MVTQLIDIIDMTVMPVIRPALELIHLIPWWGALLLMLLFFGLSILFGMIHGAFASKEKAWSIELRGFVISICTIVTGWAIFRGSLGSMPDPDPLVLMSGLAVAALTLLVMLFRGHFGAMAQLLFSLLAGVMLGKLCSCSGSQAASIILFVLLAFVGSWLEWAVGKATKDINSGARKELEKKLEGSTGETEKTEDTEEETAEEKTEKEEEYVQEEFPQDDAGPSAEEILRDFIEEEEKELEKKAPAENDIPEEEKEEEKPVKEEPFTESETVTEPEPVKEEEPEPEPEPEPVTEPEPVRVEVKEEPVPAVEPAQVTAEETAESITEEAASFLEELAEEASRELDADEDIPVTVPEDEETISITEEIPVQQEEPVAGDDGFRIVLSDAEITGEIDLTKEQPEETAATTEGGKQKLNIAVFGPEGSGKTTLTWALSLINSEFGGKEYTPGELDSTALEKSRGMTIEPSFVEYESRFRHFVHIDCPGDPEFYKNEIRGLTEADVGILVIAVNGHITDARDHLYNAAMAGIKNLIVFINKCDLDSVTEEDIDSVDSRVNRMISREFAFSDVVTVSGSALAAARDDEDQLFWINSIRELQFTLDTMQVSRREDDGEFRLPIGKVYTMAGKGTVVTGRVQSGSAEVGKRVSISGYTDDTRHATIAAVRSFGRDKDSADAGECVGLQLKGITARFIRRGQVITTSNGKLGHRRIGAEFSYIKYSKRDNKGRPMSLWDSTKLQFWFGNTDVTGEIRLQEDELHLPGDNFVVIIDLEKPVPIRVGDRFLAKQGSQTVAYGEVVRTD